MKFVKCKSCGKEISKSARACPDCGAKRGMNGCLLVFILFSIIGLCILGGCLIIGGAATAKIAASMDERQKKLAGIKLNKVYLYVVQQPHVESHLYEFENVSDKTIEAFKGTFIIRDKFGKESASVPIECTKSIPPKSKIYYGFCINRDFNMDAWDASLENLSKEFKYGIPNGPIKLKWEFNCSDIVYQNSK